MTAAGSREQLSMTASFVPPLPNIPQRRPPPLVLPGANNNAYTPGTSSLALPPLSNTSVQSSVDIHEAVSTPNPFPAMREGEEGYAKVEGVIIWDGPVSMESRDSSGAEMPKMGHSSQGLDDTIWDKSGRIIFKGNQGWTVVWKGQVPIGASPSEAY